MRQLMTAFEYGVEVELALSQVKAMGIGKERIRVAPLEPNADLEGFSMGRGKADSFDLVFILGSIFMLLGCIYGFIWPLGPIIWAIIGLVAGGLTGFLLHVLVRRMKKTGDTRKKTTLIIVEVACENRMEEREVMEIFQKYGYAGIGQWDPSEMQVNGD